MVHEYRRPEAGPDEDAGAPGSRWRRADHQDGHDETAHERDCAESSREIPLLHGRPLPKLPTLRI